jgi:hypothetical protein
MFRRSELDEEVGPLHFRFGSNEFADRSAVKSRQPDKLSRTRRSHPAFNCGNRRPGDADLLGRLRLRQVPHLPRIRKTPSDHSGVYGFENVLLHVDTFYPGRSQFLDIFPQTGDPESYMSEMSDP